MISFLSRKTAKKEPQLGDQALLLFFLDNITNKKPRSFKESDAHPEVYWCDSLLVCFFPDLALPSYV